MKLVIGSKAFSSWSLRPWLFFKENNIEFTEELVILHVPNEKENLKHLPLKLVPCLFDGDIIVSDSLAICQYVGDKYNIPLYPQKLEAKANAMMIVAHMHSAFVNLRENLSCDFLNINLVPKLDDATLDDIKLVDKFWTEAITNFSHDGGYLFGDFSLADAFYAPVVSRFIAYGMVEKLSSQSQNYVNKIMDNKYMKEWLRDGKKEEKYYS